MPPTRDPGSKEPYHIFLGSNGGELLADAKKVMAQKERLKKLSNAAAVRRALSYYLQHEDGGDGKR